MEEELGRPQTVAVLDSGDDENDDQPMLSSYALAALKEFLEEQHQSPSPVGGSGTAETGGGEGTGEGVPLLAEDWRLSQFWYEPETAETVANEVIALLSNSSNPRAACIACPTLYAYIKKINANAHVQLMEFDERFGQYGSEFTFYDYNRPEELPLEFKHAFSVVVADPPYLSRECLEKTAQTIAFLATPGKSSVLLLTGEVQNDRAGELLGLRPCAFRPRHSSKLGNEFRLFSNYDPGMRLGGWELEN